MCWVMQEVKVSRLDLLRQDHSKFAYRLAMACHDDFLHDAFNDPIELLHSYRQSIKNGDTVAFLIHVGDEMAGVVYVDIDRRKVGFIHAGLLPQFRKGMTAAKCLRRFINFCFGSLDLNALEGHIPTYNKVAEKLLRRYGFIKYGLRPEALCVNGKPETHVLLYLTKKRYEDINL